MKKMNIKKVLNNNKFKHSTMATALCAVFIAIVITLNVCFSLLSQRFPSMDIDLTASKVHSLSDTATEAAAEAKIETNIYIIGTEDEINSDKVFQGYIQSSQLSTIAQKMVEANSNIKLSYIDPDLNPDFMSAHSKDNLVVGSVVVETELRTKVLDYTDFIGVKQDEMTGEVENVYTMVDGAYANAVHVVNLVDVPVVSIATGHGDMFVGSARESFDMLMEGNGFVVEEFDILTEDIPVDTQILMLPTPTIDYGPEELVKINSFLADETKNTTLFITSEPKQPELPELGKLLEEWGIKVNEGIILESDQSKLTSFESDMFIVNPNKDIFTDDDFSRAISFSCSPIELLFEANNGIITMPIFETSNTAYVVSESQEALPEKPDTDVYVTSALARKTAETKDENGRPIYSSVIVMGDTMPLISDYIGSSSYSNKEALVNLLQSSTGVANLDSGVYINKIETNVLDITASAGTIITVGLYICTLAIPLVILIMGLITFLKRRHL